MKYLKLVAPIYDIGKEQELRTKKDFSERLMRDILVDGLWSVVVSEKSKSADGREIKKVNSLEEMRNIESLKQKLIYTTTDIIELGNDLFKFLKESFDIKDMPVTSSKLIVEIADLLDECEKQDEEKAEKEFKAQPKTGVTLKKYFEGLGVKVTIEPDPITQPLPKDIEAITKESSKAV